jgi:hypothetical protein
MSGPPREKGGLPTALKVPKLSIPYRFLRFPQVFSRRRAATRRCVSCDSRITNRNLGGNDGRSALSGELWCLRCPDFPMQQLLKLGGKR